MEKTARRPWSAEARKRHLEGCRRYQKTRAEHEYFHDMCDLAREIDVDLESLLKTLTTTDKTKILDIASIEPKETRFKAFRDLVFDTCKDATSYRTWEKKTSRGVAA